jgi:hypothetical protein
MGSFGVGTFELKRQFEEFKQQDIARQQIAEVRALKFFDSWPFFFEAGMTAASSGTGWAPLPAFFSQAMTAKLTGYRI